MKSLKKFLFKLILNNKYIKIKTKSFYLTLLNALNFGQCKKLIITAK